MSLHITLGTVRIPEPGMQAKYFAAYLVAVGFTVNLFLCSAITLVFTFLDVRRIKKESEQELRRRELVKEQGVVVV